MKIAILHTSLDVQGGAERQVLMLAHGLKKRGHEVKIYVSRLNEKMCYPNLINGLEIVVCGGFGFKDMKKLVLTSPYFMRKMGQAISDCDIINCHNYPTTYAAAIAKKKYKSPIVWTCNEPPFLPIYSGEKFSKGAYSLLYRILSSPFLVYNKLAAKKIDKILVLDYMNKKRISLTYGAKSIIVHTGLDVPDHIKTHRRGKRFTVLSVGRIDKGKRTEDAIYAIAELKDKVPDILLQIAGTGRLLDHMKHLVEKLRLQNHVVFFGRVDDKQLNQLYSDCDVFLFTAENQSWGLVPLEAMAHGKPAIVSTGCGVSEVLKENKTCLKIKPRDIRGMAKKILLLYANKNLKNKIAKSGMNFVRREFSWDRYTNKMEQIFVSLIRK